MESINRGKAWIPCKETGAWTSGEIVDEQGDSVIVLVADGQEISIHKDDLKMQNPSIQEGLDDMTNLSHLHV
ncbi:hypothetical protein SAMD00019534_104070 [Acytostelium subglobosum LB1]|uniref:hypothetical protein n=1 Tax=Acytostelium subglobosum LB1 TaxID=1410327 RepID=UPI0006448D03|nr:hypothetical protein SAMD00019534_104070 [Acytostelium subglobosum LB1]GAM27232.1 hypothetical protein SAMD00019534_104070 [Acytostelium subglobosum LB1]|eukprot:XP_012749699.1 hypothetical protein SAMD00019534_104070 [Acytostelium subglobosum LB1]